MRRRILLFVKIHHQQRPESPFFLFSLACGPLITHWDLSYDNPTWANQYASMRAARPKRSAIVRRDGWEAIA